MIQEMYRRGVSISEIARQSGRDRKTIRRVLREPLVVNQTRQPRQRKISPYEGYLQQRMDEGVYNAHKLFREIQTQGYPGGETQVRAFVHQHRPPGRHQQATRRFETEPGQQAQVDWGSFGYVELAGKRQRLYAFIMTLGWSRMVYLEFTTSLDTGWFLRGHLHAFGYFGGIPREVLHDNLKSAVLGRDESGAVVWNPRYLDFALVHGFQPRACHPYRAQTKGKVESGVHYVRINFWPGLRFSDLDDLNQQAIGWCNGVANCRVHATTGETPFSRLAPENLQPIPAVHYDTSIVVVRRASRDCLVSYEGNWYSLPSLYARETVLLKEQENGSLLILNSFGEIIAQHHLLSGRRQRSLQPEHYAGLGTLENGRPAQLLPPLTQAAPQVEIRPLSVYAAVLEGDSHE